jgi:diguanylate cyclase (GGDEF)-like protein
VSFAIVASSACRDRRRSDVDVALLFGAMAALLLTPRALELLGVPAVTRGVMVTPLILAVPYLMLRVTADLTAVPWWAMRLAEAAFISQIVAFAFQGSIPLSIVAIYAAVPIAWSSVAFIREALRARGLAGRRYAAIALGNGAAVVCLAVVAAAVRDGAAMSGAAALALQLCVLAAGVFYFVGFAAPSWLRHAWSDPKMRSFLSQIPSLLVAEDTEELIRELARGARDAMGSDEAFIGLPRGPSHLRFAGTGSGYELPRDEAFGGKAMRAGRAIVSLDPAVDFPAQAQLYRETNTRMMVAAPMRVGDGVVGALTAWSSHPSLFASDGLETCQLLADQAGMVLRNRALIEEREHDKDHDPVTDVLGEIAMYRRVEDQIASAPDGPATLLLLEIKGLAEVDQTFGHLVGDEVLRHVAWRLAGIMPGNSAVARWSRDRFAALVPNTGTAGAAALAERILGSFERPFAVGQDEIECGSSIGIAVHPEHAAEARGLVAAVEVALGLAKSAANAYAFYPVGSRPQHAHRMSLRADLRRAISEGAVRVEYQPMVSLRSGGLLRLEALTRWEHPMRGTIPPSEFVDLAERTGLIRSLTQRVLHQALTDIREWRQWLPNVRVAVNLSARMFGDAGLVDRIAEELARTGCDAGALALEITECTLMSEPERARSTITRLRDLGVTTEIDDFGTGYSSLAYLQRLPVTGLKIDRHFVGSLTRDERSDAIVRATIRLAHELGFEVVAEGIEERGQWELLAASGCDIGQGYYISRPLPFDELGGWLATWMERIPRAPAVAPPQTRGADRLVLVVDDDPSILSVIGDVLREHGHAVATASDGAEALDLISTERPQAVLLDVHMPRLDGPTFTDALRDRGIQVPVIIMSAGSNARRWAERLGAAGYLAKPFSVDELVSVMRRVA